MKLVSKRVVVEVLRMPLGGVLTIATSTAPPLQFVAGDYIVVQGEKVAVATASELAEEFTFPAAAGGKVSTKRKHRRTRPLPPGENYILRRPLVDPPASGQEMNDATPTSENEEPTN